MVEAELFVYSSPCGNSIHAIQKNYVMHWRYIEDADKFILTAVTRYQKNIELITLLIQQKTSF